MNKRPPCTVEDVVEWILKYRANKAFTGWTAEQIVLAVSIGCAQNLFLYCTDEEGNLRGVCLLSKKEPFKLHVDQLLLQPFEGLLTTFLLHFKTLWPRTRYLTMHRRGKYKEYSLKTLERILTK